MQDIARYILLHFDFEPKSSKKLLKYFNFSLRSEAVPKHGIPLGVQVLFHESENFDHIDVTVEEWIGLLAAVEENEDILFWKLEFGRIVDELVSNIDVRSRLSAAQLFRGGVESPNVRQGEVALEVVEPSGGPEL